MGGGFDLALACHARIASPNAVFAHPGGSLGIITGWGGTQRLPRLIGRSRALEMLVTGRRLDAAEALASGLIQKIATDPVSEAIRLILTMRSRADSTRA
jgi:enoyl-CoA hydratase/carnithine racemase